MSEGEKVVEDAGASSVDIESIVNGLKDVNDANSLEAALASVKPGIGNCKSRRKLKRAIDQVIGKEEMEKSMNAKVRRRVTRVMGFLAPNPDAHIQEQAKAAAQSEESAKAKTAASSSTAAAAANEQRPIPYVVFVGQLNFNTTADDLKTFFQSQNVNGSIKVRLLSEKEDGRSKGMAFVEVGTAEDMHKCIALHRSVLHGKMINIEKSCGGSSKEKRKMKIQEKRSEQSTKMSESVQRIIGEYSTSGVIDPEKLGESFKTKLFNCGPAIISKALHAYAKIPEEKRKIVKLDQLLDKFKEKDVVTL